MAAAPTVVVVGLGPAGPEYLTRQAAEAFAGADERFVRTRRHLAAEAFVAEGAVALDEHYERATRFEEAYASIVATLVEAARRSGRVAYGVPGSPYVAETTVELLRREHDVVLEVVPGLSFVDLAWDRLGIDPLERRVRLVDAERFAIDAAGDAGPLLVAQAWSAAIVGDLMVATAEPPDSVTVLHHLGYDDEFVATVAWSDLARSVEPDHLTSLYIPSLAAPVAIELQRAAEVVQTLRAECPWDAAQTHVSLMRHLLEETYEALEAIEALGEPPELERAAHLEEELGDVLVQVLFHSAIASEEGLFDLSDVARGLSDKLVRRHPHVFGGADAPPAGEVLASWEQQKRAEKQREHLLDGIPGALPALATASSYERRADAAALGFAVTGPSVGELERGLARLAGGELDGAGELLFALARLVAHLGGDPESACRAAASAFRHRFDDAERAAAVAGTTLEQLSPPERIAYLLGGRGAR